MKLLIFSISVIFSFFSYATDVHKLYRADMQRPEAVKSDGGFLPRGIDGSRPNQPPPNINLWDHVNGAATGMARHDSGYVSTTRSHGFAVNWVRDHLNNNGYVYHIDPTPNFIDVNATLRNYSPHREELEFAALGIIHWNQIIGWERVGREGNGAFVQNPDYNRELYSALYPSGAQPQLAGFPSTHPAWTIQPWRRFANCGNGLRSVCKPVKTAQEFGVQWLKKSDDKIKRKILISLSAVLVTIQDTLSEKEL